MNLLRRRRITARDEYAWRQAVHKFVPFITRENGRGEVSNYTRQLTVKPAERIVNSAIAIFVCCGDLSGG